MSQLLCSLLLTVAAPTDLTGVYEVSGAPSDVFIVLHERAEGELIGYIAGSPSIWIETGQRYGSGALIELQGLDGDSEKTWSALLRLRVNGRTLEGVLLQEGSVIPLTLVRSNPRFTNESWIWFDMSQNAMHDVSRLIDLGGNFIGGGFNSSESCMFMACGGSIDSWQEIAGNHDIWTSSTGDCGQTGHLVGAFDTSTNQLNGTWDSTDCNSNSSNGTFLGGKGGATYGKHIRALLLSLGTFADDFEAESLDAADVFHTSYMSDGTTRSDWETQLSSWYATYDDIEVEISGPDEIITVIDSDVHPYLVGDPRTSWTIRASGVDTTTGVTETFYERIEPVVIGPDLRFLGVESGRVVFIGNGQSQPLSIGLPILLADVSYDVYGAWPFGQHGGGHAEDGHGGIDFEYVPGAVTYAVADGEIVEVRLNDGHPPSIQWDIIQQIRPGVNVQYGHIADPPIVSIGDVLAAGDVVGSPSIMPGDSHAVIHFSISYQEQQQGNGDMCPIPWFDAAATADWDVIWSLSHYNEELAEPLACNDREASPPYVATWNLETAGTSTGPDAILFFRADGYAHNYDYTFFDSSGSVYETGVTEWMTSPSTIGLKFIATDGSGSLSFGAGDIIGDEMQLKIDLSMPTDMSGASVYRFQE